MYRNSHGQQSSHFLRTPYETISISWNSFSAPIIIGVCIHGKLLYHRWDRDGNFRVFILISWRPFFDCSQNTSSSKIYTPDTAKFWTMMKILNLCNNYFIYMLQTTIVLNLKSRPKDVPTYGSRWMNQWLCCTLLWQREVLLWPFSIAPLAKKLVKIDYKANVHWIRYNKLHILQEPRSGIHGDDRIVHSLTIKTFGVAIAFGHCTNFWSMEWKDTWTVSETNPFMKMFSDQSMDSVSSSHYLYFAAFKDTMRQLSSSTMQC